MASTYIVSSTWLCQDWWQLWQDAHYPPDNLGLVGQPEQFPLTNLIFLIIFLFPQIFKVSKNIETWISAAANRPPISQAESWLIPSLGTICHFSSFLAPFDVRFSVTFDQFFCIFSGTWPVRRWGRAWGRRWWGCPPPPRSSSPDHPAGPSGSLGTGQLLAVELGRGGLTCKSYYEKATEIVGSN